MPEAADDPDVSIQEGENGDTTVFINKIEVKDKRSWYSGERT